jgi:tRNA pseudouridine38-40 synthase
MGRYFIEVAYKGTRYSGFQIQANATTIQSEVEGALQILHRKPVQLTGSSRTDAGVHALQNYFHFDFADGINPTEVYKLNAILPDDIVIKNIISMPPESHSRFDAESRQYVYRMHRYKNPFLKETSLFYPYKLNHSLLHEGADFLKSQNNFVGFSKTNTQVKNYHCSILQSEWQINMEAIQYTIEANRFLRGMVRMITAALLKLGREKMTLDQFKNLFENQQRNGWSVPAHGLCLTRITYNQKYFSTQPLCFTEI